MAAENGTIVCFVHATETSCYFEDVDKDGFHVSHVSVKWIKSNNNKFLILNEGGEFRAQNLSLDEQKCHPEQKFNVQVYMNFSKVGARGVILYVCQDGKKLAVCCNDRLEVHPEEVDVPQDIAEQEHRALFYRTKISTCCYLLESSVHPSMFLAFQPDESNHMYSKLILQHKEADDVDESCHITMN